MKYIKKILSLPTSKLISVSILSSAVLVSIAIWYRFNLDVLQKIFSVIGSLSLGIALSAYFYKKTQDQNIAAIEQIAFFRKEIISEWERVAKNLISKDKKYKFSRIKVDEPTIKFMREKYSLNFQDQISIFLNNLDSIKINSELWDLKILDSQIKLLNMLEEFSLRVYHFKTDQHEALGSVRSTFVEIIEKNAVALAFMRDVIAENLVYSAAMSLYNSWKDNVRRPFIIKNLAKHGFITKKQKEEILKENKKINKLNLTETNQSNSKDNSNIKATK